MQNELFKLAILAEDPISDFDDSFELITDDAPQPRPALRAFKFCGGGDSNSPPPTARGSRDPEPSLELQRISNDDELMDATTSSSNSSSEKLLPEYIDPPEGQSGIWNDYNPWNGRPLRHDPWAEGGTSYPPQKSVAGVQAGPTGMSDTGVQVGCPRIAMSVVSSSDAPPTAPATISTASSWLPIDPKARPRKAPPPPQSPWVQATVLELRQLRRENQILQELLEHGILERDDIATAAQLIEAAQGWRHQSKSSPNPKTQPVSVLRRPGGAVDVDATLSGPGQMPGNSAPPVLVDTSALPHQFSAFPPIRQKAPPMTLQ